MICRKIPVSVSPTPTELAYEIWNMCSNTQADMFLVLSEIYDKHNSDFLAQLSYINDDINEELTIEEKTKIIHMFESVLECLKGEDINETNRYV